MVHNLVQLARQSPPVDLSQRYDPAGVAGKTIVITGGASGIGAAFARHWARSGAHLILGDICDAAGEALIADIRTDTKSSDHHYMHCDVRDWQSQVQFFREAARLSPTGGIDAVVANAAVRDPVGNALEDPPEELGTAAHPPPPDLGAMEVNVIGVLYTVQLAMYYLPKNTRPGGDRHLLFMGSVSSMIPLCGQPQYTTSKHAVMGLFRALRGTSFAKGIRVNLVCPYFTKTPVIPPIARAILAGGGMGEEGSVVDAATRLMADSTIIGRGLVVGAPARVKGELGEEGFEVIGIQEGDNTNEEGDERVVATWECYADDFEQVELFVWRYVRLLNEITRIRGWVGWAKDMAAAVRLMITAKITS